MSFFWNNITCSDRSEGGKFVRNVYIMISKVVGVNFDLILRNFSYIFIII